MHPFRRRPPLHRMDINDRVLAASSSLVWPKRRPWREFLAAVDIAIEIGIGLAIALAFALWITAR